MTYYKVVTRKGDSFYPPYGHARRYRMDRRTHPIEGTGLLVFENLVYALEYIKGTRGVKIYAGRGGPEVPLPEKRLDGWPRVPASTVQAQWAGKKDYSFYHSSWPAGTKAVKWFSPRKLVHRG